MECLIKFAFTDLTSKLDEVTIIEPRSIQDLLDILSALQIIGRDFEELLRFIQNATSLHED